jgi:hypothetical protein
MKKSFLVAVSMLFLIPQVVFAQAGLAVIADETTVTFPDKVDFHLELDTDFPVDDVKLLYRVESHSCQNGYARQKVDFEVNDTVTANWEWELKRSGTLPPGTQIRWQWVVTDSAGKTYQTELQNLMVQDQRYSWDTFSADGITIQWYVGANRFGKDMHQIATNSIDRLTNQMGLIAEDGIYITIYPDSNGVRDVLFAATEWVGGVAFPSYNATIMGISPDENEWANQVIPHELTHLLIGTMMFNCYGISAPTWLDEGLAEYGENAIDTAYRSEVTSALEDDTLPNLVSLEDGFSAFGSDARLSYKQSGVVVHYLISTYGQDKITELLLTMKSGQDTDDALMAVYGFDTNGLDKEWRASLGFAFDIPESNTETSATVIPTLSLSNPLDGAIVESTATSGATATLEVIATPAPDLLTEDAVDIEALEKTVESGNFSSWLIKGGTLLFALFLVILMVYIIIVRKGKS